MTPEQAAPWLELVWFLFMGTVAVALLWDWLTRD